MAVREQRNHHHHPQGAAAAIRTLRLTLVGFAGLLNLADEMRPLKRQLQLAGEFGHAFPIPMSGSLDYRTKAMKTYPEIAAQYPRITPVWLIANPVSRFLSGGLAIWMPLPRQPAYKMKELIAFSIAINKLGCGTLSGHHAQECSRLAPPARRWPR